MRGTRGQANRHGSRTVKEADVRRLWDPQQAHSGLCCDYIMYKGRPMGCVFALGDGQETAGRGATSAGSA
jgi:hypothetical protein